jgi:hypothetical protein
MARKISERTIGIDNNVLALTEFCHLLNSGLEIGGVGV